jgi:tRNA(Ile)-lysidine synthase
MPLPLPKLPFPLAIAVVSCSRAGRVPHYHGSLICEDAPAMHPETERSDCFAHALRPDRQLARVFCLKRSELPYVEYIPQFIPHQSHREARPFLTKALRYHVAVHPLAQRMLRQIQGQELLRPGDRVGVAVSGGIDSVALLRLLLELRQELGIVLSVVHFNHKLRGAESDTDQEFVAALAREHGLEFHCESGDAAQLAKEAHSGLEAAARELRYEFFRRLLGAEEDFTSGAEAADDGPPYSSAEAAAPPKSTVNKIATGHTADDQAETVLMRVIRGTGLRGLGGIYPGMIVEGEDGEERGEIVRPLLGIRRGDLERYLRDLRQPWREDATNADTKFTRNRVRKVLMPLLEREFNPAVVEGLSELAEIARDEEDYWENEISGWLGTVVQWSPPEWLRGLPGFADSQALVQIQPSSREGQAAESREAELADRIEQAGHAVANASLSRPWLLTEPKAVQRRIIKAVGQQAGIPLEFKHVEEILRFAAEDGPASNELSLPGCWKIVRETEAMVFVTPDLRQREPSCDYEYTLSIPGRVFVPELGVVIEAMRITPDLPDAEYNPQQLLDAKLFPERLTLRNWRPGDRFWPAHTKSPKKIKELLQGKQIAHEQRKLWPVAVSGNETVWMRGFAVPAKFGWKKSGPAVLIRQVPWNEPDAI